MELKSMTDFVLEQNEKLRKDIHDNYNKLLIPQCCDRIFNYANFLKKQLKLGYFIPCDENDVPLEEPNKEDIEWFKNQINGDFSERYIYVFNWFEAKQRVLFEEQSDFKLWDNEDVKNSNIEELLTDDRKYILTETAKKEIGLCETSSESL